MVQCGLLSANKLPVPLKSIDVELEVKDHVATVVSTLKYENKEDKPVEAVFVFPLPGDAAVCNFSAKIGQTEIVAEVKEKQKARDEYDDALSSGQQAFLLEESEQSPDIFRLSVGSLPPGENASIWLEYVTELSVEADDGLRFCLPAVLNPCYQPQGREFSGSGNVQVVSVPASLVPYSLSFSARMSSTRPVSKIESNCSLDPLQYLNIDQTQATVKLAAGHKFDRDVELLIYYKDAHKPTAVVEAGQSSANIGTLMGDPVVMVSLYPEFPRSVMSSFATCGEFVFLMDRSGSMEGSKIKSARDTLLLLLKSLPMGCYFNIYSFGSTYEYMFPKSVEYSQKTMKESLKEVEQIDANLGGTEILKPLTQIYNQPCIPRQPRQLFVFTDGEVENTKEVIDLVKKNSSSHRCFSFGIGEGASTALINGMAKEGKGHAQFITETERMQPKVMQSLRCGLQLSLTDISTTLALPDGMSVTVLSPPIPVLFQHERTLIYAQITGLCSEGSEGCVTVKYCLADHPFEEKMQFNLKPTEDTRLTIHRLGARTLIRSLEMKGRENRGRPDEAMKAKVVELSVQSGVSSSFTSFIAVNKENGEAIQGPLLRRDIPAPSNEAHDFRMSKRLTSAITPCSVRAAPLHQEESEISDFIVCNMASGLARQFYRRSAARECLDQGVDSDDYDNASQSCHQSYGLSPRFLEESSAYSLKEQRKNVDSEEGFLSHLKKRFSKGWMSRKSSKDSLPQQPERDSLLQLVSLQEASGCWLLDPSLAAAVGKSIKEMKNSKPGQANNKVWATVLALIWLHGFKMDSKDEWVLLATKAASWLRAQNAPCVAECVDAGNSLLGCCVRKDALGI
ncbi:von Willebrand factor A domain-containing protein 5A-like [Pholidichthys leucotaenia]